MSKNYKTNKSTYTGGVGILGALQIILIVLKVLGLISCSWWTVFIPTFIELGVIVLALLVILIMVLVRNNKTKKRMKQRF